MSVMTQTPPSVRSYPMKKLARTGSNLEDGPMNYAGEEKKPLLVEVCLISHSTELLRISNYDDLTNKCY